MICLNRKGKSKHNHSHYSMAHLSPLFAPQFVATMSDEDIAKRLREDESLIDTGKACRWTAWHLPKYDEDKGRVGRG
jgi:hypothetical protein